MLQLSYLYTVQDGKDDRALSPGLRTCLPAWVSARCSAVQTVAAPGYWIGLPRIGWVGRGGHLERVPVAQLVGLPLP